ncbi:hypothetical protein [Dietzia sp. 179-F 9C3 NHS]|uniref:hypothetical protein n=1 Tax=Dietzia sp. 179-F 9C3 NHS TaxID=3374295 RepID=UPI003879014F
MLSIDCSRCPRALHGCDDCLIDVLGAENVPVEAPEADSCGYVLAPEIRSAIEVLRAAGLLSEVEIVGVQGAA